MEKNEKDLIANTLNGNLKDFSVLIKRYQGMVNGLALTIVKDPFIAKDVSQETFMKVLKNLRQLKNPSSFQTWLKKITINTSKIWLKKQQKEKDLFGEEIHPELKEELQDFEFPETKYEKQNLYKRIIRILNSLSPKTRIAVTLCYIENIPYRKAAAFLHINENTLRKRLHDGKKKLQRGIVKMAENMFDEFRLPEGFAEKCICGCKIKTKRMEVINMENSEKKNCGCGCEGTPLKNKKSGNKSKKVSKKKS